MLTFIDANPRTKLKWTAKGEFQGDKSGASTQELAFLSAASILLEVQVSWSCSLLCYSQQSISGKKEENGMPRFG